ENLGDTLAVIDIQSKKIEQRLPTENYPYAVAVSPAGQVFVSAWGGETVSVFAPAATALKENKKIKVGRHPSALLLNNSGSRLFVASAGTNRISVIDTKRKRAIAQLADPPPSGPDQG